MGGGTFSNKIEFSELHEGTEIIADRSSLTEISSSGVSVSYIRNSENDSNEYVWKDYTSQFGASNLSIGSGTFRVDATYANPTSSIELSHDAYTSNFKFIVEKVNVYNESDYGCGRISMFNSGCGFEISDISNQINDIWGMSLKFTNPALPVTQTPIYGFTSTDLSSNTNKDKFVYTAKAVEDRLASVSSSGNIDLSDLTGTIIINKDGNPSTIISNESIELASRSSSVQLTPHGISTSWGGYIISNDGGSGTNGIIFNYDNYNNSSVIKLVADAPDTSFAYSEISFKSYVNAGNDQTSEFPDGFIFTNKKFNTDEYDPYGVSFKMLNLVEGHAEQVSIYGFVNEHDGVIPEKLVYTAKGVEDYVKDYTNNFIKYGTYDYDTRTETPTKLSPSGFIEAYDRGGAGDNTYIRVSGKVTYDSSNGTYVDIANSYTQFYSGPTSHITVHSVDGADVCICDNKLHLPVYNQDGTLAKNSNVQEYVAIKAVKDATTGTVSLVVMQ